MYWLLVGLVRSLKSSHKEALRKPLLCEVYRYNTTVSSAREKEKIMRTETDMARFDWLLTNGG